jgi:hypothetical protein
MKTLKTSAFAILCLLISFAAALAITPAAGQTTPQTTAQKPDKKEILAKARQSYYVLQNEGLKSFQCVIQPNWTQLLAYLSEKPVAANDPLLAKLSAVQYSAVIDEQGSAKVTPVRLAGANADSNLDQIIAQGQQVVDGFFKSWGPMVVTGAFPEEQDQNYDLSDQPDGYHFIQKAGDASIELILTRDVVLTAMKVTSPTANVLMLPKYSKTEKGLLMSGVDTDINKGTQVVNFQVQYQTIEGFQLPGKVSYQVTLPSEKVSFDLSFTQYQLTRR